jgi:hypothetical protein
MASYNVEDVFVTEGVPEFTFVEPPNYNEILIDVRKAGKPVIIEGQSGTGKTTAIKRILRQIGSEEVIYLTARKPEDVERIEEIALNRGPGSYVIDDFHRLKDELRENLANIAKIAAEQGSDSALPKLIIIGINQVGSDLIQLVSDIGKRIGIHRIAPGTRDHILKIIEAGCEKLNIYFNESDKFYEESRGDYWLTQQLCQSTCAMNNIIETSTETLSLPVDLAQLRSRVVSRLQSVYYPAVKEFCRGRRFRPSNDPYYKLLRTVGQQESSAVDLNELANAIPEVRGSINNIKDRRLEVLMESKSLVRQYFFYNAETKNFAVEDPALFYFLRHLDWNQLRTDCGFREITISREWEVAVSFAGENRDLARHIASQLEFLDVSVFFDELYEDNYLGRVWSAEFKRVFSESSDLIVCILDDNHLRKIWPTFERDCFSPRVQSGEVIPIFLDNSVFPGIPRDIVGINFTWDPSNPEWKAKASEEIVMRLIDRV